jgi:hypothetical protein
MRALGLAAGSALIVLAHCQWAMHPAPAVPPPERTTISGPHGWRSLPLRRKDAPYLQRPLRQRVLLTAAALVLATCATAPPEPIPFSPLSPRYGWDQPDPMQTTRA